MRAIALGAALALCAAAATAQNYLISETLDVGGTDLAIGPGGQIYVAGVVSTYDLAGVDSGAITNAGYGMRYVARIDVAMRRPLWVAVVGPAMPDFADAASRAFAQGEARGMALGADGSALLVAHDGSRIYPLTGGQYQWASGKHVFKVSPTGQVARYSPALDPAIRRVGAIALDAGGNIYVTGGATSGLVTTPNAPFPTSSVAAGCVAPFAIKLDATGQTVVYSTYLGYAGTQGERCGGGSSNGVLDPAGFAVVVDPAGNAVIGGQAEPGVRATAGSPDLGSKQTTLYMPDMASFASHAFVSKINASGTAVDFTARLGGSYPDRVTSLAIDATGAIHLGGKTASSDFPLTSNLGLPYPISLRTCPGFVNAPEIGFVAKLAPDGKQILHSGYLPVAGDQLANCGGSPYANFAPVKIALDATGRLYATGPFNADRYYVAPPNSIFTLDGTALLYVISSGGNVEYSTLFARPWPGAAATDGAGDLWVAGDALTRFTATARPFEFTNPIPLCATGGTVSVRVAGAGNFGTVEFFIDGTSVGSGPVAGGAASKAVTAMAGARRIYATYRGTSYFDGYSSEPRYMPFNQAGACP